METTRSQKALDRIIVVVAVLMGIYHFAWGFSVFQSDILNQNTHLAFGLVLVFLTSMRKKRRFWPFFLILVLLSVTCTAYVQILFEELQTRELFNTTLDLTVGCLLIFLVMMATREAFGNILVVVAGIFLFYMLAGQHFPGVLRLPSLPLSMSLSRLSIGLQGVYGKILSVSANYVAPFILFGFLLQATGASRFFNELGKLAGSKLKGGAGIASVISSSAVGTVTGMAGTNVMITGSFTIPLMKKVGYKPEQAGAIEAAASTGGMIMPPIMGVAAFMMSGMTGIAYGKIILAAILPALLYFFCVGLYVQLRAMQQDISFMTEKVDIKELLLSAPLFIVPFAIIVFLMLLYYRIAFVGSLAIVSVVLLSFLRKETRPTLSELVKGVVDGMTIAGQVAACCALLGIIVVTITATGLGVKLPMIIAMLAQDNVALVLVLAMLASLILGMGLPSIATYVLVALACAPLLLDMGLTILQAHFFPFFFGCMSFVTPPVGIAALFASRLSGASYMKTGIEAVKVAASGFIIPFMVVWVPMLLLLPQDPVWGVLGVLTCFAVVVVLQITLCGYFLTGMGPLERILSFTSLIAFIVFLSTKIVTAIILAIILFVLLTIWQLRKKRFAG